MAGQTFLYQWTWLPSVLKLYVHTVKVGYVQVFI